MLRKLLLRLSEPSTWAAIGAFVGLTGLGSGIAEWVEMSTGALTAVFGGLLALLGAVIPEKGSPDAGE